MSMTDPIADMLTRIRNAGSVSKSTVEVPYSRLKARILEVMKAHGFISDFDTELVRGHATLKVKLKYGPEGQRVINHLQRVSKPGCRRYVNSREIPAPLNGLGLGILSTSKGVVSHVEARRQHLGGEVLCEVW